ncbi:MAG TPA: SMC-Scp complex subunit ScpB, partial [Selenomonas sp.]|nr:SMC-Scp complex subunit ScpB [Selenomonas sp.]
MEAVNDTALLEAVLFAAGNPVQLSELARVLNWPEAHVDQIAQALKEKLARDESGLTLRQTGGGWKLVTLPQVYPVVERLAEVTDRHIAAPTMETLSIIAFKQPITKQEIEQIRGVRVERALQKLLELNFIEENGRKQTIGRPILYGTTDTFLQSF